MRDGRPMRYVEVRWRGNGRRGSAEPFFSDDRAFARACGDRRLRDRYLEHVNDDPQALRVVGKYDVARALPDPPRAKPAALLPAA